MRLNDQATPATGPNFVYDQQALILACPMIKHIDSRGEEQVAFFGGTMAVSNKYTYNLTTHGINDGDLVQFGSYNAGCSDNWYPQWYRYDSRNTNQIHFNLIGTAFKTWFELKKAEAHSET